MIKVFESFAGVGTQRMALRNLGIEHEVVGISEIDKFALKSYMAIHGETKNFGDITKIKTEELSDFNLFTYSFPCQDISVAGKQEGLDEESGTRSSLLWECERIIKDKRPNYLLMENVKNLVGKRHKKNFDKWLEILEGYGYTNYWQVLNAKDYGIPQNRERVFVVSRLDGKGYTFPKPFELEIRLKDILEDEVDEKYYLREEQAEKLKLNDFKSEYNELKSVRLGGTFDKENQKHQAGSVWDKEQLAPTLDTMQGGWRQPSVMIKNATKKGYIEATDGDGIDLAFLNSDTRRGRVQNGMSQTLDTRDSKGVINQFRIRKLTPLECWRLMGILDEDFYKAQKVNSNSQLYKQAGNAIVVDVLEGIFKQLFNPDETI